MPEMRSIIIPEKQGGDIEECILFLLIIEIYLTHIYNIVFY